MFSSDGCLEIDKELVEYYENLPRKTDAYAEAIFNYIKSYIEKFQDDIDGQSEVGLVLAGTGSATPMYVDEIRFEGAALIVYKGRIDGKPATLIQHIAQTSVLLTSLPKRDDSRKKIGFIYAQ